MLNYDNDNNHQKLKAIQFFFLILTEEELLAFTSSNNFATEVKNVSPNFKRIT